MLFEYRIKTAPDKEVQVFIIQATDMEDAHSKTEAIRKRIHCPESGYGSILRQKPFSQRS
jgi:hypothetical protein